MKIVAVALLCLGLGTSVSAQSFPPTPSFPPLPSLPPLSFPPPPPPLYPTTLEARAAAPIYVTVKTTVTLGPDGKAFQNHATDPVSYSLVPKILDYHLKEIFLDADVLFQFTFEEPVPPAIGDVGRLVMLGA
ncbi:MAG: hypothetical protein Q9165_000130 [Trypethelium subeluteriae]